jgi:hemerythrin
MQATATQFMAWSDNWLVGIREVDTQHKHLVSLLNKLHEAMGRGEGKKLLGSILSELVNYTKAHFAGEERLMRQYNYAEYNAHKQEHDRLAGQVLQFQQTFSSGGASVSSSVDVLHFLRNWLQNHICGTDKKYVPFLQSKGVQ